jgi:hypothetical protein
MKNLNRKYKCVKNVGVTESGRHDFIDTSFDNLCDLRDFQISYIYVNSNIDFNSTKKYINIEKIKLI